VVLVWVFVNCLCVLLFDELLGLYCCCYDCDDCRNCNCFMMLMFYVYGCIDDVCFV